MTLLILQHVSEEPLGYFEEILNRWKINYEYVRLFREVPIIDLKKYSGLIIMGGPMNVYEEDKYPFLKYENHLIQEALALDVPILGICLGAQLIAKAAGAKVTKSPKREIGWFNVQLTPQGKEDKIFQVLPNIFKAFQWHGDTFKIPEGAIRLAGSRDVPNQAFRLGNAYGLQFHLEMNIDLINSWVINLPDDEDEQKAEEITHETSENLSDLNFLAENFLGQFIKQNKII